MSCARGTSVTTGRRRRCGEAGENPRLSRALTAFRRERLARSVIRMITARGLTKHYGRAVAVQDLTFTVRPGVVTGFLGPNGAGKSTTMRMLVGLDRPDAGEVLAFTAFAAFHLAVRAGDPDPSLSQPGVLRAVLLAGACPALVGLIGLGLAGVIRNPVGAIAAITGLLLVLPLLLLPLGEDNPAMKFLPEVIAENSLTAVKPVSGSLSAGAGFGLLCLYAAAALAAGGWALARRDA
jgi:ABC transporter